MYNMHRLYMYIWECYCFIFYIYIVMLCWCPCVWCIVEPKTNFHLWKIKELNYIELNYMLCLLWLLFFT